MHEGPAIQTFVINWASWPQHVSRKVQARHFLAIHAGSGGFSASSVVRIRDIVSSRRRSRHGEESNLPAYGSTLPSQRLTSPSQTRTAVRHDSSD
jgi:hypothetical protein